MVYSKHIVTVRLIGMLRTTVGVDEITLELLEDDTIGSILSRVVENYSKLDKIIFDNKGEVHSFLNIFVDDKPVIQRKLNYPILSL